MLGSPPGVWVRILDQNSETLEKRLSSIGIGPSSLSKELWNDALNEYIVGLKEKLYKRLPEEADRFQNDLDNTVDLVNLIYNKVAQVFRSGRMI